MKIFTEFGSRWDVARVLSELGQSTLALGNELEAEAFWRESLRLARESEGILTTMDALFGFASLLAKRGDHRNALELLMICLNHPSTVAETKARAKKLAADVKEKLTLDEIQSAETFAEDTAFEVVVKEILGQSKKMPESN